MNIPAELRYTSTHEWIRSTDDGLVVVGITDHAQELLGDIVFLDLPTAGRQVEAAEECAVVESVKAASDIYAPVAGEIVESNQEAADNPELVNRDAYAAWLFKIRPADPQAVSSLLDADGYRGQISG